jgi:predicted nucleic acid-binding protein
MKVVALDTNVVLRLVHAAAPEHAACRQAVLSLAGQGCRIVVPTQVLVEFWVVATRPTNVNGLGWSPGAARAKIDQLMTLIQVLPEPPDVFRTWLDTVTTLGVSGKRAHDARIAATLRTNGVHDILTLNDADFSSFPEIGSINPLSSSPL